MRILIVAGGTGGHIFPAISLAGKLKEKDPASEIIFCIDKRADESLFKKLNLEYRIISAPKMPYGISLRWILFLFGLVFSSVKSAEILNQLQPDIVVGFGAYISGPILAQAKRQKRKVIIHEQNVIMGRANCLLSKTADKIAVSFANPKYTKDKRTVLVGNPIRENLLEDLNVMDKERARRLLGLDTKKPAVLIMGGSLGSRKINTAFLEMLKSFPELPNLPFQIIHLTGKLEFDNVQSAYNNLNIKTNIYSFYDRMGLLYKAADFAVCRAGAITLSEMCVFALPCIIIPYAGAGAHQRYNAAFLKEKGAAFMLEEKDLSPKALKNYFLTLFNNKEKLDSMSKNANALGRTDASEKLAKIVLSL